MRFVLQYLRDYYVDKVGLIPPTWLDDPSQFHLRSDNALRTEESGQALFSGLYPEATDRLAAKTVRASVVSLSFGTLRWAHAWRVR